MRTLKTILTIMLLSNLYSACGQTMIYKGRNLTLTRWSHVAPTTNIENSYPVSSVASSDFTRIGVGFRNGVVKIFSHDLTTGSLSLVAETSFLGNSLRWSGTIHEEWGLAMGETVTGLSFQSNTLIHIAYGTGEVAKFDTTNSTSTVWPSPIPISAIDFAFSNSKVVIGGPRGTIAEYQLSTPNALVRTLRIPGEGEGIVGCLRYLSGETKIFSSLRDYKSSMDSEAGGSISNAGPTIWNATTGSRILRVGAPEGDSMISELLSQDSALVVALDGNPQLLSYGATPATANYGKFATMGCTQVMIGTTSRLISPYAHLTKVTDFLTGKELGGFSDNSIILPAFATHIDPTGGRMVKIDHSGRIISYSIQWYSVAPSATPTNQIVATYAGRNLVVTHEFLDQETQILEVDSNNNGTFVATRSRDGKVSLWRKVGPNFVHHPVAVNTKGIPRTTKALNFSSAGLLVCDKDNRLWSISCSGSNSGVCVEKTIINNTEVVPVVSARLCTGQTAIVTTNDGRILNVDLSTQTVISTIYSPPTGGAVVNFIALHRDKFTQKTLAVPDFTCPGGPQIQVIGSTPNCQILDVIDLGMRSPRVGIVGDGMVVFSDTGTILNVPIYDLNVTPAVMVKKALGPFKAGIAAFSSKYVLGFGRFSYLMNFPSTGISRLYKVDEFQGFGVNAVDGTQEKDVIFLGLDDGRLLRVQAKMP